MRNVLIPVICLLLGLAAGYMISGATNTVQVTPDMIEKGIRENPKLVIDLLQQHPEEVFDVVIKGQEIKRKKQRDEQIMSQLMDPVEVDVADDRPVKGSQSAPITILEFSDFQCPHCAKASETVEEVVAMYPDDVNLVFLHYPLSSHQYAPMAAAYFEAASLQNPDKAWQLHDMLFQNQEKLQEQGEAWLREAAESLDLDMEKLVQDLAGEEVRQRLQDDMKKAKELGLRGTPTFVIGGILVSGALPKQEFVDIIELLKEKKPATQDAEAPQGKDAAQ